MTDCHAHRTLDPRRCGFNTDLHAWYDRGHFADTPWEADELPPELFARLPGGNTRHLVGTDGRPYGRRYPTRKAALAALESAWAALPEADRCALAVAAAGRTLVASL